MLIKQVTVEGKDFKTIFKEFMVPVVAILLALIVGSIFIKFSGRSVLEAYKALFTGALGGWLSLSKTLVETTPLIFTGLAVAFAFRCGLFNIGGEGQFIIGAIFSAYLGYTLALPGIIHIPVCLMGGIIGGGVWGALAGWLKARYGAHEVITTIMLNFIASKLGLYLVNGPMQEPTHLRPITPKISASAELWRFASPSRLNIAIFIGIMCIVLIYYILQKTTLGYEIRAVGFNPWAAEYAGITVKRNIILAMFISGALAGMAGATQVMGIAHSYNNELSAGLGFQGIAVALLGRNNPFGVGLAAFLFGALINGAIKMQSLARTPKEIIQVIQGLVIIFVAADQIARFFLQIKLNKKRQADAMHLQQEQGEKC